MTEAATRHCIYCDKVKPAKEFSLEHIFPDALGGASFPEVFKTRRVCGDCNSRSGLFVDGAFVRQFFIQHKRADAFLRFADLETSRAMPMRYMGILTNIKLRDGLVCEVAVGPNGGVAYHVHPKLDEKKYGATLGSNPIEARKKNGDGVVFLLAQFSDLFWNEVFLELSKQYNVCGNPRCRCKDPENPQKHGPYYQLSYTHKGRSTTEFIKEAMVSETQQQIQNFREFKKLTEEWIDLSVKIAKLRKKKSGKNPRQSKI